MPSCRVRDLQAAATFGFPSMARASTSMDRNVFAHYCHRILVNDSQIGWRELRLKFFLNARSRALEINSVMISALQQNLLFSALKFPVRSKKFPVPLSREFACKALN
jgi:hypothetical protein